MQHGRSTQRDAMLHLCSDAYFEGPAGGLEVAAGVAREKAAKAAGGWAKVAREVEVVVEVPGAGHSRLHRCAVGHPRKSCTRFLASPKTCRPMQSTTAEAQTSMESPACKRSSQSCMRAAQHAHMPAHLIEPVKLEPLQPCRPPYSKLQQSVLVLATKLRSPERRTATDAA